MTRREKEQRRIMGIVNSMNMSDFGARWYDVAGVPMWTSVDPLTEKYYHDSPYAFCHNHPINRIDIDGLYDFEGISNWSNPVIAVFSVAEQRDRIIQLDYQSAHDASSSYNYCNRHNRLWCCFV